MWGTNPVVKEEGEFNNSLVGIIEGGYTHDSVIPPLLSELYQAQFLHGHTNCINEIGGGSSSSSKVNPRKRESSSLHRETGHIEMEKNRREQMTEMYSVLQSMVLPNHNAKISREAIVSSTIQHIQKLEKEVARLEDLKMKKNLNTVSPETMEAKPIISCTNGSSSVEVRLNGSLTFFGIQLPARRGSVTEMFRVFQRHQAEVLATNVVPAAIDKRLLTVTVTAVIGGNRVEDTINKIKREILTI